MRVAVCSDLHLEFGDIVLKNTDNAEVLILSGDIMVAQDLHDHPQVHPNDPTQISNLGRRQAAAQRYRDFLSRCSFQFPHVIFIAGNHEFYHGKFYASIDYLREECAKFPNVYFLEQDTKEINDVVFMGGTLWTDMNKGDPLTLHAVGSMMNDFRIIKNDKRNYASMSTQDVAFRHRQTLEYFKIILSEKKDKKCVVVGHHAPSFESVAEMYHNDTLMNGGYFSNLTEFILDHPQIALWTHGHMHNVSDYKVGDTRVICNPRGYINHEARADEFELLFLDI
jgi:predicted phosphodiesterase